MALRKKFVKEFKYILDLLDLIKKHTKFIGIGTLMVDLLPQNN
jgi:hypothetical protein